MENQEEPSVPSCGECGAEMIFKPCPECGGKGGKRVAFVFKKNCKYCNGAGGHWRCPEEQVHRRNSLNVPSQPIFALSSKEPIYPISPLTTKLKRPSA
jgi:hypothetical protein